MKNQYEETIWYYPYIENDVGNRKHLEIIAWLRENVKGIERELWNLNWTDEKQNILQYKPQNLYVHFKSSEMAMAFKLRWL